MSAEGLLTTPTPFYPCSAGCLGPWGLLARVGSCSLWATGVVLCYWLCRWGSLSEGSAGCCPRLHMCRPGCGRCVTCMCGSAQPTVPLSGCLSPWGMLLASHTATCACEEKSPSPRGDPCHRRSLAWEPLSGSVPTTAGPVARAPV